MVLSSPLARCCVLATLALAACGPRVVNAPVTPPAVPVPDARPATPDSAPASFVAASMAPRTRAPEPTVPAITANDLRTRLYIVADDSMLGREAGEVGNVKVTDYIAGELRRMGLTPAGEGGSYFQRVPLMQRALDASAPPLLAVGDSTVTMGPDLVPFPVHAGLGLRAEVDTAGITAVYGGALGDSTATLSASQAQGRLVVLTVAPGAASMPSLGDAVLSGLARRFPGAAAVAIALPGPLPARLIAALRRPRVVLRDTVAPEATGPVPLLVTGPVAQWLMQAPPEGLRPGATGAVARVRVRFAETPTAEPARNVVAVLPGSDPALRGEYVAIGAHSDHVGIAPRAVNHDSLRATRRILGEERGEPTAAQQAAIAALTDSLTTAHGGARADSIFNGADDDGSGTVTVLEIAQAMAAMPSAPRRSTLFVWHTGEEGGMLGSEYFTDNPTVPRDSIVTQLNMDMVGRGAAGDIPGGGAGYLQLVGSRRLSTQLGDLVEAENAQDNHGFTFDYTYDAPGQPENIYCRSDHYSYARYGIPIVFFTTGLHQDYHQVTDEPQYIDYPHMANVARLVRDIAVKVGNLDQRPVVDQPKPDPNGVCRQ